MIGASRIPHLLYHALCMHGVNVDHLATHGLSYCSSEGPHSHHASVNIIIHKVLTATMVPFQLQPSGKLH